MDRRTFLAGLAGLPSLLPAIGRFAPRAPRSLLLVWLDGGMSHLDTFDAKPEAPVEVRGDLPIRRANVDGVFVSAHLPRLAERMDRVALLRSVTHGEGNHDRGAHLWLTGQRPTALLSPPALGAVLGMEAKGVLPPYVAVPEAPAFAGSGFLPRTLAPFVTGGDPGRGGFAVANLEDDPRRRRVQELRERLDALDGAPRSADEAARDGFVERAGRLAADDTARRAFDLQAEPAARRERYGLHRLGQSCLLGMRLLGHGVRTVLVADSGWDHHQRIDSGLAQGFPPKLAALDQALGGLLDDLRDGVLDDQVLVCVASEFGRTPRLNPEGGRDHWPRAQSVLLFGAGIRPGVVGSTDARGEEPADTPVSPPDVFATLLAALGVDPGLALRTPDGRPMRLVQPGAAPLRDVLRP